MSISKNKLASDIEKNQTIKPAEQHFIQPTREPMENDQLAYYAYTRIELTQRFLDKYRHRQEQASQMTEEQASQMTEVQEIPKKAAPAQAPPQPALSEKDQKNLRKEMEKKKKAGLKLTPGATCYTIDLMEQMKKDVAGKDSILEMLSWAHETVSSPDSYGGTEEESRKKAEQATRRFVNLLSFAPQIELDSETKDITKASKQQQLDFLDDCVKRPQKVMKEFKKKMFAMEVDPDKYTWQYVGEHFQEIHQEQQMLKGFLELFREGTPEYETLRPDEKAKVRMMGDLYAQSNRTFQSALQANGLKYTKYGLTPMTQAELQKDTVDENAADVKALRDSKESLREQLIEDISGTLQEDYDQLRKDKAQDPDTSFITSKRLNNIYQYTTLHEARKLIELDSNKYHANKKLIDILYNEIQNLMESMAIYQDRLKSVEYARLLSEGNKKEEKILVRMGRAVQIKMENLTFRTNCIMDGLRHLMKGDPMDYSTAQVMHQYGYEDPAYEEKIKLTAKYGRTYADNYRKRKQALEGAAGIVAGTGESEFKKKVMSVTGSLYLMQINGRRDERIPHNNYDVGAYLVRSVLLSDKIKKADYEDIDDIEDIEDAFLKVREHAKKIIEPYIKIINEFDVLKWSQYSDEELASHQEELMDIVFPSMAIFDMGSYDDPENPEISIMEALIEDEKERALFSLNCSLAQGYLKKARALAMRASYINGTLTQDSLLPFEYDNAKDKESGEITEDSLLAYAKKLYIEGAAQMDSARSIYAEKPAITKYIKEMKVRIGLGCSESEHRKFEEEQALIDEYFKKRCADLKSVYPEETFSSVSLARQEGRLLLARIANLQQSMQTATNEKERAEMEKELMDLQKRFRQYEIYYALKLNKYRLAGEDKELINEPIFRHWGSVDSLPAFQSMNDDEFYDMCRKLAAGGFHFEDDTPEQTEEYRNQNREGLMIYKEHMSTHYHQLEAKYHHKIPPLEYRVSHFSEMLSDFANAQVDINLVGHSKDMIARDAQNEIISEEDKELYHLVIFYAIIGDLLFASTVEIPGIVALKQEQDKTLYNGPERAYSDKDDQKKIKNLFDKDKNLKESYEYLIRRFQ